MVQRSSSPPRFPPKDRARGKSTSSWIVSVVKNLAITRDVGIEEVLRVEQPPDDLSGCEQTGYWFAVLRGDDTRGIWID